MAEASRSDEQGIGSEGDDTGPAVGRSERRRQRRERDFLEAAQRVVTADGLEGLTMSRIAAELDTAVSAVYRYFPSKGALVAELQRRALERLAASLHRIRSEADDFLEAQDLTPVQLAVTRLVLAGRWLCATGTTYPDELKLLQEILSWRAAVLDPEDGERIFPMAMSLVGQAVELVADAQAVGALDDGNPIDRAVIWASALGGVLQTDDLAHYAPEVFGEGRLARRTSLDLLIGWGASPDAVTAADELVNQLADRGPLAP